MSLDDPPSLRAECAFGQRAKAVRVLVFGGRSLNQRDKVYYTLDDYHAKTPITLLIHGSCRSGFENGAPVWSADELAEQWAKDNAIPYLGIPAIWYPNGPKKLDRSAGPTRNALMITKGRPQAAIGFPGGKGSADMYDKLVAAQIPVLLIPESNSY